MEERYTLGTEIGEGAFGRVFLAIEKRTGKRVRVSSLLLSSRGVQLLSILTKGMSIFHLL